jgi:hypothetical protein
MQINQIHSPDLERARAVEVTAVLECFGLAPRSGKLRCPFPDHDDKNPSFSVFRGRDGRERWKCHGCGRSGDAIALYQLLAGVSFSEAVRALSR